MIIRVFLLTILFAIPFLSCQKENDPPIPPDNIHYQDPEPDITVTSIDSFTYAGIYDMYYECYKPCPEDSIASLFIDMDQDNINDFRIYHRHWLGMTLPQTSHNWCQKYQNYNIGIETLQEGNFVLTEPVTGVYQVGDAVKVFSEGDMIDDGFEKNPTGTLYLNSASCMCFFQTESPEVMIGVFIEKNDSTCCGWISLTVDKDHFILQDYAINLTGGKGIEAGAGRK